MPTHGGVALVGPIPDMMIGLRLINAFGKIVKIDGDDIVDYRAAMGYFWCDHTRTAATGSSI
jgi:hypothetical protein